MPDDKTKVSEPDRSRVAANQDYEVGYRASKYGLSSEQVRELIARVIAGLLSSGTMLLCRSGP
jgi:hypothetical protein